MNTQNYSRGIKPRKSGLAGGTLSTTECAIVLLGEDPMGVVSKNGQWHLFTLMSMAERRPIRRAPGIFWDPF